MAGVLVVETQLGWGSFSSILPLSLVIYLFHIYASFLELGGSNS
jgi:hypothetical protein